jgi:hypothetical protein
MTTETTDTTDTTEAELAGIEAPHGQKMIEVTLRFWTDSIAEGRDTVIPKHVWSSGVVKVSPNPAHGIRASRPVPFSGLSMIVPTIEDLFVEHGIKVHPDKSRTRRYIADSPEPALFR